MYERNTKSYYKNQYKRKNSTKINKCIEKKKFISSIKELINQQKLNKALSEVEYYLEEYPNDSYGLFQKGTILLLMEYIDDAEYIFNQIIELDLESKYSSLYKLGVIYIVKQNFEKAEYYYRKNVETSPYPEIHSRIGLAAIECMKGNIKNAELLANGDYDKEVNGKVPMNIFERFKYISQEDKNELILEKAKISFIVRNLEETRDILNTIDQECLNTLSKREYNLLMGKLENTEQNYELALEYLKQALPGTKIDIYWKTKLEIAICYMKLGDIEAALSICEYVMNENSFYKNDVRKVKGDIYQQNNQYKEAKEEYLKMNNSEGTYNIGKMKFKQKDYEEAFTYFSMGDFKNAISKANNNFYKMMSLLKLGRYEEAYRVSFDVDSGSLGDLMKRELKAAKLYLRSKTDRDIIGKSNLYTRSQVIDYDIEKAIAHINREHQKDGVKSSFYEDRNIEELICELPSLLEKEDVVMVQNLFFEIYEIPYKNLGLVNGSPSNTLRVVLLPNSYNVITMFPTIKENRINNKQTGSSSIQKQKTKKSQVDKFYEKYGKK